MWASEPPVQALLKLDVTKMNYSITMNFENLKI